MGEVDWHFWIMWAVTGLPMFAAGWLGRGAIENARRLDELDELENDDVWRRRG